MTVFLSYVCPSNKLLNLKAVLGTLNAKDSSLQIIAQISICLESS
jgi:hypothetical protein